MNSEAASFFSRDTQMSRVRRQLAIAHDEIPDFLGVDTGLYLTDISSSRNGSHKRSTSSLSVSSDEKATLDPERSDSQSTPSKRGGNVLFFDDGVLKIKSAKKGVVSFPERVKVGEHISIDTELRHSSPGSVILGKDCCPSFKSGGDLLLFGRGIGKNIEEGNNLIAIGPNTLRHSSVTGEVIAIGSGALGECENAEMTIGIGKDALMRINDAYNVGIGVEAGKYLAGKFVNHCFLFGRGSMRSGSGSIANVISGGTYACEEISGTNFSSVYLGEKVAQHLKSPNISINNVGIGTKVFTDASNISDMICIGSNSATEISGVRSLIFGSGAANQIEGALNNDLLFGYEAGTKRKYTDSKVLLFGMRAGYGGSGVETIGIGNEAGSESHGNINLLLGKEAGVKMLGDYSVCFGFQAGYLARGSHNFYGGSRAGLKARGDHNVWLGEGGEVDDYLERCVVIGPGVRAKGTEAIVIGSQAGKSSLGYLHRDILIGANAGMGQKYNQEIQEDRGLLIIGANAGIGHITDPDQVNSRDVVMIGHSAGNSDKQSFQHSVILGNYAASYAENVTESLILGHGAGTGMDGEQNLVFGFHSGKGLKGDRCILIGTKCGDQTGSLDPKMSGKLAIGHDNKPLLFGDLEKGNLLIGARDLTATNWVQGQGTIGFVSTDRPTAVKDTVGGVLYSYRNHLEYTTSTRTTVLTFPYKFIYQGDLSNVSYGVNTQAEGVSLLTFKVVPVTNPEATLNETIRLINQSGILTCEAFQNPLWNVEVVGETLRVSCRVSVKGISYLEVVGVHITKKL